MRRLTVAVWAVFLTVNCLLAQQNAPANQNEVIQSLLQRIDQLEKRVAELEKAREPVAAASPAPAAAAAPAAQPAMTPGEMQAGHEMVAGIGPFPNLKIAGFSDFNFSASDRPGAKGGFNEGQFILHLNSNLSQRVVFLGELSLTARSDAGTGSPSATGFNAEVERSIIRFEQSDYLKLSFGRYHTPINYWNTQFHHGQWLQTSVSRPEMTQFGGSFIPVHFVGALLEGAIPAGGLNLNYNAGIGNGRGAVISRAGDFGDVNYNRAWLVNLFARPSQIYGLQFGGAVYHDKITPLTGPETREWIRSAHIVWNKEDPEIIAEIADVSHRAVGDTRSTHSLAWYVQLAYRLPYAEHQFKPYYRFEYIHIPAADVIFRSVPGLAGSVAGLRYDATSYAAFKFEYRNQRRPGIPRINTVYVQTAFTF